MRTIIDLPASQLDALDAWCRRERISRAEAVRRAVAQHVAQVRSAERHAAFGVWRSRGVDGLAYERRLRREWGAPALAAKRRRASR